MLHLRFALNFERLADDLMNCIKAGWEDPFRSPVVIFPDKTLEQWFKLRWMENDGVIANLNTQHLDRFLFSALAGDKPVKRVSGAMLRNIILGWLWQKSGERANWQTISEDVTNYLMQSEEDGRPDENRLFDFASQMAELFLDYETSRPGEFMSACDGVFKCWRAEEEKQFFRKAIPEREAWQRRFYQRLFVDRDGVRSVLSDVCEEMAKTEGEGTYLTLPALYESCRGEDGNVVFEGADQMPIFLFWHAGMGQFYRVAINEFAKTHEVYAFVQNPCMTFWEDAGGKPKFSKTLEQLVAEEAEGFEAGDADEDNDNELLVKWGHAGRVNIQLWCQASNYDFDFKEEAFDGQDVSGKLEIKRGSLLHEVQWAIANRLENLTLDNLEALASDGTLTHTSAPSRLREVEALHSRICKLLQNGGNIRDILVVAPDINAYRSEICQVFDQEKMRAREARGRENALDNALHIPFTIIDGAPRESLTARAVDSLFRICRAGMLGRPDFFELVRNPLVQLVRGIDPDEISSWENWVTEMNVYRDRFAFEREEEGWHLTDHRNNAWSKGVRRLLMARLTPCRIEHDGEVILPYADLDTGDNGSLCRFVDCIDALEDLCLKCSYDSRPGSGRLADGLTQDELNEWFVPFLNSWVSMRRVSKNMAYENMIYQGIMKGIEHLKVQYAAGVERISWKTLEQTIRSAAETSRYTVGTMFVNGLTFMSFTSNRIIPVRHMFMIGMDAAGFPGRNIVNSLDLCSTERWPGDNSMTGKNRYAFLCQFMCTSESFHISYVNKDLQKDDEFFPTSVVNDLRMFIGKNSETSEHFWKCDNVPLDEIRGWQDLFTGSSFRNRKMHDVMTKKAELEDTKPEQIAVAEGNALLLSLPERVSFYNLRLYLEDPFQFRVKNILEEDEGSEDNEKVLYEPTYVKTIQLINTVKELSNLMVVLDLKEKQAGLDATLIREARAWYGAQENALISAYFRQLSENGALPDSVYEEVLRKQILRDSRKVADQIIENGYAEAEPDFDLQLVISQTFDTESNRCVVNWLLNGKPERHLWNDQTLHITGISLSTGGKTVSVNKCIKQYVSALALVLRRGRLSGDMNERVEVCIHMCFSKGSMGTRVFSITPELAEKLLKDIYNYAYIQKEYQTVPIDFIEKSEIETLDDLDKKLHENYGAWTYFKKGKMFDIKKDVGYNMDNFADQWKAAIERQRGLISPLMEKEN